MRRNRSAYGPARSATKGHRQHSQPWQQKWPQTRCDNGCNNNARQAAIARLAHTIDRNAQRRVLSEPLTPDLDTNRPFPTNEAEVTYTTPRAEA
ncbi:MAG: hypothetical protein AAF171_27390, partial [Cyanobacteria bacterium P01_A01_bin.116]